MYTLFGCIKKAPPLGFGPRNVSAHSGHLTAVSEMGFELQGCLNIMKVPVFLAVWGNTRT